MENTMKEIMNPEKTAVIIIDMQKDFCSTEGFGAKTWGHDVSHLKKIVKKIKDFLIEAEKYQIETVYTKLIYNPENAHRMQASGGARYPIELYVISNNVDSLEKGLYHYCVYDNTLETLLKKDLRNTNLLTVNNHEIQKDASALIIATGVLIRQEMKYLWASYPLALLETGDMCAAIYMASEFHDLGCCSIQGFYHKNLIELLDINPEDEIPLQMFAIGDYHKNGKNNLNSIGG